MLCIIIGREHMTKQSYSVYFAGPLFNRKDLVGNRLLSSAIEDGSANRYEVILPQEITSPNMNSQTIRNQDLLHVMAADTAYLKLVEPVIKALEPVVRFV